MKIKVHARKVPWITPEQRKMFPVMILGWGSRVFSITILCFTITFTKNKSSAITPEVIHASPTEGIKEYKPKRGEYIEVIGKKTGLQYFAIHKETTPDGYIKVYAQTTHPDRILYDDAFDARFFKTRMSDGDIILQAIKNDQKQWNPEEMKIEGYVKAGQKCIFWDDDYRNPKVGILHSISIHGTHKYTEERSGVAYKNCEPYSDAKALEHLNSRL